MFWLKKVLGYWLMPLPFCMALLFLGLFLARSGAKRRHGIAMAWIAASLLLILSNSFVSIQILRPFEAQFPAIPEVAAGSRVPEAIAGCHFVVVLGSANANAPGLSAIDELSPSGLRRLAEAVRILRFLPGARLILSGPGVPGVRTHAAMLAAAAISLGVSPERITLVDTARDTDEEARAVKALVGSQRVAVVTSAWHMPRAARIFTKAGVSFVPCPADFFARSEATVDWGMFKFDSEALERSTLAVHEAIGVAWVRLLGD
jgi:uncharacterized SAM-binding protein YcdF (DUF218 family)